MTFKKLIYVAALINLLTIGEVLGAITATGKLTQNVTRGKDISIIWKLKSLIPAQLNIYVNTANTDDKIYGFTLNPITKSGVFIAQANKEIEKRSSAAYNYLGNVDGIETGEIVLNITNVTLNDEMVFILFDLFTEIARTNLSVIFPGERRGEVLKKEYPVKQRQVAFQYCGKPEPIVTCTSDGAGSGNGNSDEVSEHCYNYTITLPKNLKPCKKKSINCVVTSYDKSSFPETITARGEPPKEKTISTGECAGYIIGFVIGVIVICVFIYLYVVIWNATTECGKLASFIVAFLFGLALIIALPIAYSGLRDGDAKCPIESTLMDDCDTGFIVCGVIGGVGLIVVIIISVIKNKAIKM